MMRRIIRVLPVVVTTTVVLLAATAFVIIGLRGAPESWTQLVSSLTSALASTAVGFLVATKQRANPAGWLLQAGGLLAGIVVFDLAYAPAALPGAAHLEWLTSMLSVPVLTGVVVLLLLTFPDGHLMTPRWRLVSRGWAAGILLFSLGNAFHPELLDGTRYANPFAIGGTGSQPLVLDASAGAGAALVASAIFASVASASIRFRRSRGIQRQQMKWFVVAVFLIVLGVITSAVTYESGQQEFANTITALSSVTFPIAIGVAILRYRLYEIDRIVNRTVVYTIVVAALAGLFTGGVALASTVLPTGSSDLGVAVSTLAVAALFNPLRRKVQAVVNRRFYRSRYDPQQVADRLARGLSNAIAVERVESEWLGAAANAMQPRTMGIWLKDVPKGGSPVTIPER